MAESPIDGGGGPATVTAPHVTNTTENIADSGGSTSGNRAGEGEEVRGTLRRFLDVLYGGGEGYCHLAYAARPYLNDKGEVKHEVWSEAIGQRHAWRYPTEAETIIDTILLMEAQGLDAYVCTNLMSTPTSRAEGNTAAIWCLHADCDGVDIERRVVEELGGCLLNSGSPGHFHLYIPLSEPITLAQFAVLQHALVAWLGADCKKAPNGVLRPPCTRNYKNTARGGEPTPVQVAAWPRERGHSRAAAEKLGVDLDSAGKAKTNGQGKAKDQAKDQAKTEDPKPFDLDKYPRVAKALTVVSDPPDRSRDLHRVVRAVHDEGLGQPHAEWAVRQREDLAGRIDEHPGDVTRSWAKIVIEQRLARTDKGNATLLAAEYSSSIRFVPQIGKWMHWNGMHWHIDSDSGAIDTAAGQIATDLPGSNQVDLAWRRRSLSAWGIGAMVRLARSDPMMRCSRDRLDANGWQLNTPTGIVDLRAGEVRDHRPDSWHTKVAGVGHGRDDCPLWKEFLKTTFQGDQDLIDYVQGLCGQAAIGEVLDHILPFFWGPGQNGKTVLLEVVSAALGDYAITAPANFLLGGRDKHETEIARLAGARFVVCSEINQGTRFDEAKVKRLTGGDTLTGRFMRGDFFDFRPSHLLVLVGNHQPAVGAGGVAFWRRLRLVPFTHQVPEHKRIEGLAGKLVAAEGPAILGWITEGAARVASGGLATPARVLAATEEYEESEDRIKQFLDDCTTGGIREDREPIGGVYQRYTQWCDDNGIKDPLESRVFAREIYSRGYKKSKSGSTRYVHGLRLDPRGRAG